MYDDTINGSYKLKAAETLQCSLYVSHYTGYVSVFRVHMFFRRFISQTDRMIEQYLNNVKFKLAD